MTNLEFKVIMDVFDIKKEEINEDNEYNFRDHKITYYPDGSVLIEHIQYEIEKKKSTKHSCVNQGWFVNKKEDLVTVIYELQKSKDLSNIDEDADKLNYYNRKINKKVLEKVIPSIGTYKWMQYDIFNNLFFERAIKNSKRTIFNDYLRELLDKFDMMVNPYMIEDIDLDYINNYMDKIDISGDVFSEKNDETEIERHKCCKLVITDKSTNNKTIYERHIDGFCCILDYMIDNNTKIFVKHSFQGNRDTSIDRGEFISITYCKNDEISEINYNITKDKKIEYKNCDWLVTKLSFKEKLNLIWDLLCALEYAESVTLKNMVPEEVDKVLEKKF